MNCSSSAAVPACTCSAGSRAITAIVQLTKVLIAAASWLRASADASSHTLRKLAPTSSTPRYPASTGPASGRAPAPSSSR